MRGWGSVLGRLPLSHAIDGIDSANVHVSL